MNLHTEKEYLIQNQQFAYKLRNLYLSDIKVFEQINDFIPFSIHINKRYGLDIIYANNQLKNKGYEIDKLIKNGGDYLAQISCPTLLQIAKKKTEIFGLTDDSNSICSYLQNLKIHDDKKYVHSNKLILDDDLYFNISSFNDDLGIIGKVFKNIFEPIKNNQIIWQYFLTLTKQEKEIMKLLADGKSNNDVSEILNISSHTVHSHRRNIYKKLNINKTSQLVRFAIVLELL